MNDQENETTKSKMSSDFVTRLGHVEPEQKVRAIVLLQAKAAGSPNPRRQSGPERRVAVQRMRRSAERALGHIDEIIKRFDGQLQASQPDALGSIPIEISAAGINALAASPWVKAIIEDQPIHSNLLAKR